MKGCEFPTTTYKEVRNLGSAKEIRNLGSAKEVRNLGSAKGDFPTIFIYITKIMGS